MKAVHLVNAPPPHHFPSKSNQMKRKTLLKSENSFSLGRGARMHDPLGPQSQRVKYKHVSLGDDSDGRLLILLSTVPIFWALREKNRDIEQLTYSIYNETNIERTPNHPISCLNIMILKCCQTKPKCLKMFGRLMHGICFGPGCS